MSSRKNRSPEEQARRAKIRELLQASNINSMEDIQDLFKETIAEFMENGLDAELDEELGYSKYDYKNKDTDNSRNGHSSKTLRTSFGDVEVSVPRDRKGEFEPQLLKKNQTSISQDIEEKILSMYDLLMNMVREEVHDKRVIELIKRFLKSGVMENGLHIKTEEGSPQGGPLSPLLANIYLNKFDHEMESRGVHVIRYADDIVVLARTPRAGERLLESSRRYLEGKLKLKMNMDKSRVVSVYSKRNFKFLGFALGKGKDGVFIRAHAKSLKKAKQKLKELTSRSQGRNVRVVMYKVKVFIRGWLGYFYIASMRNTMKGWDEWLRRRFRMYIWKQWKKPRTRMRNLMKLGVPDWRACAVAYSRKAYWRCAKHACVNEAISSKRLALAGYYSILDRYESLHLCG